MSEKADACPCSGVLLHTCCAPCTVKCAETFTEEGMRPCLYWYNPNIHPCTEYRARRDALLQYAAYMNLECKTDDEYGLIPFIRKVLPVFEREEEADRRSARPPSARCAVCYRMRLEKTAARAAEWGFEFFSTTLLVSPYQNHELVRETAEECGEKYAVRFLYRDFRPLFREGKARARDMELYMQKYCGCIFSEEERYLRRRIPAAGIARA